MAPERVYHTDDGGGCFDPTTLITMSDDTVKPICTVKSGEWVKSYDIESDKWIPGQVGDVYEVIVDTLVTLCFDDVELILTPGHPVYARDGEEQGWYAGDAYEANEENAALNIKGKLKIGMDLKQAQGWVSISDISIAGTAARVWNLRNVEPAHTLVADGVLVHNSGGCFLAGTPISMGDGSVKAIEDVVLGDIVKTLHEKSGEFENNEVRGVDAPVINKYIVISTETQEIKVAPDHPLFIRKASGRTGWACEDTYLGHRLHPYLDSLLRIEKGDFLYTVDSEWACILNIESVNEEVQAFNLRSVARTHNFFAGGALVHNRDGCLIAGTPVWMADGTEKAIEDVVVGDVVKSWNNVSGEVEDRAVRGVEAPVATGVHTVYWGESGELTLTGDHPVRLRRRNGVICWGAVVDDEAQDAHPYLPFITKMEIGDQVYNMKTMSWEKIRDITSTQGEVQTYNLCNVENNANFTAGSLLVHNTCGGCFLAGTLIKTPGDDVAIETLQAGDEVISYDLWAAKEVISEVGELQITTRTEFYDLIIVFTNLTSGVLQVTPEHPVFFGDAGVATWASMDPAATMLANPELGRVFELEVETPIRVRTEWANLKYIVHHPLVAPAVFYNLLNVGDVNTFFAGEVLVHNKRYLPAGDAYTPYANSLLAHNRGGGGSDTPPPPPVKCHPA